MPGFFPDMSSFSGFRIVSGEGVFLIFLKCPGFLPFWIFTLNLSVVVTHIIVQSSCGPCFSFRTYFQTLLVDPNTFSHSPVQIVHTELCAVQLRT